MFKILVGYPTREEENRIVTLTTQEQKDEIETILSATEILELQKIVRRVPVAPAIVDHALDLVRKTRVREANEPVPDFVRKYVSWGAGPRACQQLVLGGKARAVLQGRFYVSAEDIRAVAKPVLRHRVITNFTAEAEGVTVDKVVERLLETTPATDGALTKDPNVASAFKS